jgi:hypothetical protein
MLVVGAPPQEVEVDLRVRPWADEQVAVLVVDARDQDEGRAGGAGLGLRIDVEIRGLAGGSRDRHGQAGRSHRRDEQPDEHPGCDGSSTMPSDARGGSST